MKKIDWYIIRQFLGTYIFSIVLILTVAVVFDLTEKIDDFFESQVPLKEIIFDYYINFIPFYTNLLSQLFTFISVIFFTSKMASNSEIIAILASGISYRRLMVPYFVSATILFVFTFWLGGYVIPPATGKMLAFTDKYIEHFTTENARNVQMEVAPGTIFYIESFQKHSDRGYRCSLEHFDNKALVSRITADRVSYDSINHVWHLENYIKRDFHGLYEEMTRGERLDTVLAVEPDELFVTNEMAQEMTNPELRHFIVKQEARGAGSTQAFLSEYHKRWASPIGAFIMTLLGVTMSTRKIRGGMGKNLGIGIALSAVYILFSTVSTTFAVNGVMSPFMAAWLPNIIFLAIGIVLYIRARR